MAALHVGVRAGLSQGASARPHQLLVQSGGRLLLGQLHGNRADLQLRRGDTEGRTLSMIVSSLVVV